MSKAELSREEVIRFRLFFTDTVAIVKARDLAEGGKYFMKCINSLGEEGKKKFREFWKTQPEGNLAVKACKAYAKSKRN